MTATTRTIVQVQLLDESNSAALYHRYPRQTSPQDCYVELDLETGDLSADWNGEIGNEVPMRVWNGITRRYHIPCLRAREANALLEEIAPLAQRVLDGAQIAWNGSDNRGNLNDDAHLAEQEIEGLCERAMIDTEDHVQVWDASDYLDGLGGKAQQAGYLGITAETTDADLAELAKREWDQAPSEIDRIEGLEDYLIELRDYVREVSEED